MKKTPHTILETIFSQIISQKVLQDRTKPEELELLEFDRLFFKKIDIEGFLASFTLNCAWFMSTILIKAYCDNVVFI